MRASELMEESLNKLEAKVLVWLIGKGLSERSARIYLDRVGVETLSKEMNIEKEKQEEIVRNLERATRRNLTLQSLRNQYPEYVTYMPIDSNTKNIIINDQKVGILRKDKNMWSGTIQYDNVYHQVGPTSIMKVQDEIDMIAFKDKMNESF